MTEQLEERLAQLRAAITAQESLRPVLGDAAVDTAIATLRSELENLEQQQTLPRPGRAERKPVTILFADLVEFTPLSEQTDPETVRRLMNACFDALETVVERYGGHVDKYIGDEIMVLFGAPVACEDHAERALRTALAMEEALQDFNAQLKRDGRLARLPPGFHSFTLRIGINTGLVIAGGIGAQAHQQYSVIGDAVNVAARLAEIGEAGQILVGEETYRLTAPLFEFTPLDPILLKGKQKPQQVYSLHRLRPQPGQLRGLQTFGLDAPLIGRSDEMAHLQQAVARLKAGQGGVVSIIGEAGVGKSRLVAELRQQVPLPWYEGRCLSYGEMLSYHLFLALLRHMIGVSPEADPATIGSSLHQTLDRLTPARAQEIYPYMAELVGIPLSDPSREHLNNLAGESRQWQTFHAFEQVLTQLGRRSPTVVVMEDLHWADPTSLALLERLLPIVNDVPILFLLVMRPYYGPLCQQTLDHLQELALPYEEIMLSPLLPEESQKLIAHLLIIEALPASVRELILSRAEGNPLFLEEILRALIGQGVLRREDAHWQLTPGVSLEQISIPTTLQGVILARLDRLEMETKEVLQMAAVIGRIFWYRVLDYVTSVERRLDAALEQHLARMEEVELIRQTRSHPDLEYIFKHVLIQEAAYHSLLREQQRRFHQRVAAALETIFADNPEEHYGLLARHYEAAGQAEQALRYLLLAGDRARRVYSLAEAEDYYRRAIRLLSDDDEETRRQLLFNLGLVHLTQGDFTQAGEYYAKAFHLQQKASCLRTQTFAQRPLRFGTAAPIRTVEVGFPIDMYTGTVNQQLFAGLVEFSEEMNLLPHMAERWEVDAGGQRYRFHLRQDACWSDGTPLTAHDFVYAWRRWLTPATASEMVSLLFVLRGALDYYRGRTDDPSTVGVRALDDHTLEIELENPVAYFLPLLTSTVFFPLPSHLWPSVSDPMADPTALAFNGPFRMAEYHPGGGFVLERNPCYCGISRGNVERIVYIFRTDSEGLADLYADNEIDVCRLRFADGPAFNEVVPPERFLRRPAFSTFYCGLVPSVPPLDDPRVRRALAMAIDRPGLARFFPPDSASVHARGGFVPIGMPGHSPELAIPHDPDQARALLQEAGYADGSAISPLSFILASALQSPLPSELIRQWKEVLNVEVETVEMTIGQFMEHLSNDPPHLFTMTWIADYPDPHNFLSEAIFQAPFWRNPSYRAQVSEAGQMMDMRRRMSLYHELDRQLVVDEALYIPLAYGANVVALHPRVLHYPLLPVAYSPMKDVVLEEKPN